MSIPIDAALNHSGLSERMPEQLEANQNSAAQQEAMSEPNSIVNTTDAHALSPGFCETIAPQATRYAMSIVRCWNDAEEIVQEAFCRLINSNRKAKNKSNSEDKRTRKSNSSTPSESESKAILFATIRNLSIDQLRKQGRRKFEPIDSHAIPDFRSQPNESKIENLEASLEKSMQALPANWSDALQLKINGDLTYDEISKILGVTHGQVRTWIFRARKQLQLDLQQTGFLEEQNIDSSQNRSSKIAGGNK